MAVGGDEYAMFKAYPTLNEYAVLDEALISYISKVGEAGIVAIDKEVRLTENEVPSTDEVNKGDMK